MYSICLLLKLRPGCEQEYRKRHDELWPEMATAMNNAGVSMVIYLSGEDLFLFATATSKDSWDELDRDPVTPRWDAFMTDVLADGDDGKTFVKPLPQMFAFGEFARGVATNQPLPSCHFEVEAAGAGCKPAK